MVSSGCLVSSGYDISQTSAQTDRGGRRRRGGGDRDRAGTACSVAVSSTKASPYWPYIGAAVRVLGTPCCDCITAAP